MSAGLIVKNTFIDVAEDDTCAVQSRRSSSLPRSWKPPNPDTFVCRPCLSDACGASDDQASTVDTDYELTTDYDYETRTDSDENEQASAGSCSSDCDGVEKVALSLCDVIAEPPRTALRAPSSTKLSTQARLFQPTMPAGMKAVLMAVQASLGAHSKIMNVQMSDARLGDSLTILGTYARKTLRSREVVKLLAVMKMVLLDAAASSEETYVMGHKNNPFKSMKKVPRKAGFSCQLGSVSAAQHDSTCWETYHSGFCPRKATCRWCHPLNTDLVNVTVMLMEIDDDKYMCG
jgi:hypothetical protein